MTIISISLNDTILKDIERIKNEHGYSGRSEVIRAGVRLLISESKNTENLVGEINSILLVIHHHDSETAVSNIKHDFKDITKTQIHSHFEKEIQSLSRSRRRTYGNSWQETGRKHRSLAIHSPY